MKQLDEDFLQVVENNNMEAAKFYLRLGANVDVLDNYRWTALMLASCFGYEEIVKLLLAAGADVNMKDNSGRTALVHASAYGRIEVVSYY